MYYQACYSRIQIDVARLQIQVDGFSCTLPQLKVHDLLFLCRNNYISKMQDPSVADNQDLKKQKTCPKKDLFLSLKD